MQAMAWIATAAVRPPLAPLEEAGSMNQWTACAPMMSKAPAAAPRLNEDVVFMNAPEQVGCERPVIVQHAIHRLTSAGPNADG
jgi:hypothetical protein